MDRFGRRRLRTPKSALRHSGFLKLPLTLEVISNGLDLFPHSLSVASECTAGLEPHDLLFGDVHEADPIRGVNP